MSAMRAITLWQPWATLVAIGAKRAETRSWEPPADFWDALGSGPYAVGGPPLLAIHAAKRPMDVVVFTEPFELALMGVRGLPTGAIVAVAEVHEVIKMREDPLASIRPHRFSGVEWHPAEHEAAFGDYRPGRFAWLLGRVWKLAVPLRLRGRQRLWHLSQAEEYEVRRLAGIEAIAVPA